MQLYFKLWVTKFGGVQKLADHFGCSGACVRKWLRGEGPPDAAKIAEIIRLSKGKLTFKKIFEESTRNKK